MKCQNCGFEDEGKFCSNCGQPLNNLPVVKPIDPPDLGDWQVCISFGKSTSANFEKALYLAKAAPYYIETQDEHGKPIYQGFFGRDEYLQFITLYELIGSWKSCFVLVNNEIVDRKIIGNINYCYGDKLRSGNQKFCFGASSWTENPFGCHRAQMHRGNDPWYSFGQMDTAGTFHVDKEKIYEELKIRLYPYRYCPALSMENILERFEHLPKTINPKKQKEWEYTTRYLADGSAEKGVQPKSDSLTYGIKISLDDVMRTQDKPVLKEPSKSSTGFLAKLFRKD